MSIETSSEELFSLQEAANRLGLNYRTVWNWKKIGTPSGVHLETVAIGTRQARTSLEACRRYMAQQQRENDARDAAKHVASTSARRTARVNGGDA